MTKGPFKDEKMNKVFFESEPTFKKHMEELDEATSNIRELCSIVANHHRDLNVDIQLPVNRAICLRGRSVFIRREGKEYIFPIKEITMFERFVVSDNIDLIYAKLEELK